jgi:hypothetical protein
MSGEVDAEHLVRLPLVPSRPRVDIHNGLYGGLVARDEGSNEHAVARRDCPDMDNDVVARSFLVDGESQSKKSQPSRSRAAVTAATHRSDGTSTVARAHRSPPETLASPVPNAATSAAPTSSGLIPCS